MQVAILVSHGEEWRSVFLDILSHRMSVIEICDSYAEAPEFCLDTARFEGRLLYLQPFLPDLPPQWFD
jgi:hypothetical protein